MEDHLHLKEESRKYRDTKNQIAQKKVHVMEGRNASRNYKKWKWDYDKSHENHKRKAEQRKKEKEPKLLYCGKSNHFKNECEFLKKKNKEKNSSTTKDNLVGVIYELNMIIDVDYHG